MMTLNKKRCEQESLRFRRLYGREYNLITTNEIIPSSPLSTSSPSTQQNPSLTLHGLNLSLSQSLSPPESSDQIIPLPFFISSEIHLF